MPGNMSAGLGERIPLFFRIYRKCKVGSKTHLQAQLGIKLQKNEKERWNCFLLSLALPVSLCLPFKVIAI